MLNQKEEEALLALFNYLPKSSISSCYIDRASYTKYTNSPALKFRLQDPYNPRAKLSFSKKIFEDISTEDELREKILAFFRQDGIHEFEFKHILMGDITSVKIDKASIVKGLEYVIAHTPATNENRVAMQNLYTQLYQQVSPDVMFHDYLLPTPFVCRVDNLDKFFSPQTFLEILTLPADKYKEFIYNLDQTIGTATKTEFMFALKEFGKREHIFEKYVLPDEFVMRFAELNSNQAVDFEAINQFTSTEDDFQGRFSVSPRLEREILKGMPKDYSLMQQAIYIYMKMCKVLTYDQEFYAANQGGIVAARHEDIEHLQTITPTNNEVVCYEFNSIYSHFLSKLGINYSIESRSGYKDGQQLYGGAHASLSFRCDKFLVKADSVESIFNGDLALLKTGNTATGIKCLNKNEATFREFGQMISQVATDIAKQEHQIPSTPITATPDSYQEALHAYTGISNASLPPVERRVAIIREQMNQCQLDPMDAYAYLLQLRHLQFTPDEQDYCFKVSILRENPATPFQPLETRSIWATSKSFALPENPITYYSYKPGEEVEEVAPETVLEDLQSGRLAYINRKTEIPGITYEGGKYDFAVNQDQWKSY